VGRGGLGKWSKNIPKDNCGRQVENEEKFAQEGKGKEISKEEKINDPACGTHAF